MQQPDCGRACQKSEPTRGQYHGHHFVERSPCSERTGTRMSEPPIGRGLPQNQRRLRSGSELPNANLVTRVTLGTRKRPYYSKLKKEGCHAPNSINSGCRHPSHRQRSSHSKGIFANRHCCWSRDGRGRNAGRFDIEGNKASKANNTNEAKAPRKANPRKEPPEPKIRNRRGMTQKSQKSRRPRRSRLSLSLTRHRPNR